MKIIENVQTCIAPVFIVLPRGDERDSRKWRVKYLYDTCKQKVLEWGLETHDLIKQVLKENGILK